MNSALRVGIPLYPGFDSLDVLGPFQVFTILQGVEPLLISETGYETSFEGVHISATLRFKDVRAGELDVIFVPGTNGPHTLAAMQNETLLSFVRSQVDSIRKGLQNDSEAKKLVCSVCTGALILAHTGALDGYTATTHWGFLDVLKVFPLVTVPEGFPRWYHDRDVFTGGGISSGLDEALAIAAHLTNREAAEAVQLIMQYQPGPPFNSGDPSVASEQLLERVTPRVQEANDALKEIARSHT